MNIDNFIENFAGEFEETPIENFSMDTEFKSLEEWNSLTALSITGADLRKCVTIKELFDLVSSK